MPSRLLPAALALVAAAFVSPAPAQTPSASGLGDKTFKDSDTVRARSAELERISRDAKKPDRKHEPTAEEKFPQIKEDFERIQIVNGEVLQSARADHVQLAEAAAEVHRRAARLSSNLFPPGQGKKPKAAPKEETDARDLKALLAALDASVERFVHSPLFQNIKVVNPDDSAKARRELEEIIRLSALVGREAGRLKKSGGR